MKAFIKQTLFNLLESSDIGRPLLRISDTILAKSLPSKESPQFDTLTRELNQGTLNAAVIPTYPHHIWPKWASPLTCDPSLTTNTVPQTLTNQSERTWTTLRSPFSPHEITIDQTGLISPFNTGWSIEHWMAIDNQLHILPLETTPTIVHDPKTHRVFITTEFKGCLIETRLKMDMKGRLCFINTRITNKTNTSFKGKFFIAIRPYNQLGLAPIKNICYLTSNSFVIDSKLGLLLTEKPDNIVCTDLKNSYFYQNHNKWEMILQSTCPQHLASGFCSYTIELSQNESKILSVRIPAPNRNKLTHAMQKSLTKTQQKDLKQLVSAIQEHSQENTLTQLTEFWENSLNKTTLLTPDSKVNTCFQQSINHVIAALPKLNRPSSLSYSHVRSHGLYKMLTAALSTSSNDILITLFDSYEKVIKNLYANTRHHVKSPETYAQTLLFLSQIYTKSRDKSFILKHRTFIEQTVKLIGSWSAPNSTNNQHRLIHSKKGIDGNSISDYYLWDSFWAIAALKSIASIYKECGLDDNLHLFASAIKSHQTALDEAIPSICKDIFNSQFLPVSTTRLNDSDIIHSLASVYPLGIFKADDPKITETLNQISLHHIKDGKFYSSTAIKGFSPSQNLQLAHTYLQQKNPYGFQLFNWVTSIATDAGTWPEFLHAKTLKGTIGEGHHIPSNADYILFIKHCLVDDSGSDLILCPHIPSHWTRQFSVSKLYTAFGSVSFSMTTSDSTFSFEFEFKFVKEPKAVTLILPEAITSLETELPNLLIANNRLTFSPIQTQTIKGKLASEKTKQSLKLHR